MEPTMNNTSSSSSSDTWEYKLPRSSPKDIIELEEKERQDRIKNGVDPMLLARMFRVQTELMHKHIPTSMWNDAKASLSSSYFTAKEATKERANSLSKRFDDFTERAHDVAVNLTHTTGDMIQELDRKSKEFAVSTNNKVEDIKHSLVIGIGQLDEKSQEFSVNTNQYAEEVRETLAESANEIQGESNQLIDETKGKMGEIKLTAIEEKERARRMNSKQDPILENRRSEIQSELTNTVKLVN